MRRRTAATSFVQDLFGLVVQAPCPVDYQDSAAEGGAPAAAPSGPPAHLVPATAANGPVLGAKGDGAATGAASRPESAEEAQSWRRQPTASQQAVSRPNGQVRPLGRVDFGILHVVDGRGSQQHAADPPKPYCSTCSPTDRPTESRSSAIRSAVAPRAARVTKRRLSGVYRAADRWVQGWRPCYSSCF